MATNYLITCECGNQHSITPHQAGAQLPCDCGKFIDAPPLSKLRLLPEDRTQPSSAAGEWGPRQAIVTAGSLTAIALLGLALWFWVTLPEVPRFDPMEYSKQLEVNLRDSTPLQLWMRWELVYQDLPERGFQVEVSPFTLYLEAVERQQKIYCFASLGAAGLVVLATVVGYFSIPPSRRRK